MIKLFNFIILCTLPLNQDGSLYVPETLQTLPPYLLYLEHSPFLTIQLFFFKVKGSNFLHVALANPPEGDKPLKSI